MKAFPCSLVFLACGLAVAAPVLESRSTAAPQRAAVQVPAPLHDSPNPAGSETAVIAGGCFWGIQGVYQHVKGVRSAVSGYSGGDRTNASYAAVASGRTGHAEAVRITFDPAQVSYGKLLQIFFTVAADPTTRDFQGPDHGTQYRTAIFPQSPRQQEIARRYIDQLAAAGVWKRPIVTRIEPFKGFYPAEAYHQDFLTLHPDSAYIRANDQPKIAALKRAFPALYRRTPVLVRP
ncbi:peptide-methionine (S)-S-oxide reductase MsrA [Novosphingobium sp. RL4]|uniref:peptide-methionine (S)-S-oxide reductase MsrA n=1 Tax=Novosphingobium sp. RL4 TaxID=3109595 RepID=UPI002D79B9A0|nr:peptide-methionine (S)-S-oxide reductase MsrA [Novosphingobium sp. RL4]WRT95779.1 peptide-methionine (S)-S-oxide reductase MsrA [Novosphingobium sp. RL4]